MRIPAVAAFFASLSILLVCGIAFADPMEEGWKAYRRGDYETAFRLLKPVAEKGNARAQSILCIMYTDAQGLPVGYAEGAKWCRKAAEQGSAEAQSGLGNLYLLGQGVPQDPVEAAKWLERAAAQGLAEAQLDLGTSFMFGVGVPQDNVSALMWLTLAASGFSEKETEKKKTASTMRDILASTMPPAQISEAQHLAREWKPKKE